MREFSEVTSLRSSPIEVFFLTETMIVYPLIEHGLLYFRMFNTLRSTQEGTKPTSKSNLTCRIKLTKVIAQSLKG